MNEQRPLGRATLGALGVVYGDIGTSPLYALRDTIAITGDDAASVLGVLSLIFWSLAVVVTLKYIVVTLRSDNAGEGGTLSLLALVQQKFGTAGPWAARFVAIFEQHLAPADWRSGLDTEQTRALAFTLAQLQASARQILVASLEASVARLGRERLGELIES